uniref:Uncharacterized protein n=1 Tax=Sphaerodactylus townsendi TaxID=933632 RepID=A0ACB8ERE8_9SAUR
MFPDKPSPLADCLHIQPSLLPGPLAKAIDWGAGLTCQQSEKYRLAFSEGNPEGFTNRLTPQKMPIRSQADLWQSNCKFSR